MTWAIRICLALANTKGALEKRINGFLKNGWLKSARKEGK